MAMDSVYRMTIIFVSFMHYVMQY